LLDGHGRLSRFGVMPDFLLQLTPGRPLVVDGGIARRAAALFETPLKARTNVANAPRARLIAADDAGGAARVYCDARGLLVCKGLVFDPATDRPVGARRLFESFHARGLDGLRDFEGTFALAAWNERAGTGLALNDQVGTYNLHWAEQAGRVVIATNALVLARCLGLGLDAAGALELLVRGQLIAPSSLYAGANRLGLGECALIDAGGVRRVRRWRPYQKERPLRFSEAAEVLAERAGAVMRRHKALGVPIVADLTSGYDSRMVLCAALAAGLPLAVTVNGDRDQIEVRVASEIADALGITIHRFVQREIWTRPVDPEMRRELVYRTAGELCFTEGYHQLLTRPQLSSAYRLHFTGGGNDTTRYHPWGQEFFGIGRRRLANVDNAVRYRFLQGRLQEGLLPPGVFDQFRRRLAARVEELCREGAGARTTAQLDGVHVWKMTGHFSAYSGALSGLLTTIPPLNAVSYIEASLQIPWVHKLTSQLARAVHARLSPAAAAFRTQYGSSAAPPTVATLHREAQQTLLRAAHLLDKVDRSLFSGRLFAPFRKVACPRPRVPYVTAELRALLNPDTLFSRNLYGGDALAALLGRGAAEADDVALPRVATLELICRELDQRPDEGFWDRQD
jgi:hypothetical protein